MTNMIETATDDDLRDGLDMTESLYQLCQKKYEDDEAAYWLGIHNEIYEELQRRGIEPYPNRTEPTPDGKKFSW